MSRSGLGSCDRRHKLPFECPIIFRTSREAPAPMPDGRLHDQKIALTAISIRRIILLLARTKPAVPPTLSDRFLDAEVPGDDSVFVADANGDEDIYHNGSSVFSGNAVSAEVADLAAGLRTHVLAHVVRRCTQEQNPFY